MEHKNFQTLEPGGGGGSGFFQPLELFFSDACKGGVFDLELRTFISIRSGR
jgi:hypothetical protein